VSSSQTVTASSWTSSNTSVATVSNGTATGKGSGSATITAKYTPAGSTELSASATLTVKDVITYSLSLDPATATIGIDKTQAFTVKLTTVTNGVSSTETVTATSWTSSDTAVATVANGVATGKAEGTATITAKYTPAGSTELSATASLKVVDSQEPNHPGDPVEIEDDETL